ncbi:MAG: tetratricopeptide repeat protein, partial [Planctomycetota bacterium]
VAQWGFPLDPPENVTVLRALALIPDAGAALLGRLAQAEFDDRNYDKALEAARKALAVDEDEKNALEVFVKVLAHYAEDKVGPGLKQLEDGMLPALKRLAAVDPGGWTAPKLLGRILLRREQFDEALGYLTQLQRNCPLDPSSYAGLAGIYLERHEPDLALPQLLELARADEHDPDVPAKIGAIYAQRGKLTEARHWYRQALYIDPFRPATHTELAAVLMRLGDTRAALEEYQVLCELEPTVARHFTDAALASQKIGDTAKAKEFARKAVALDPASPARTLLD